MTDLEKLDLKITELVPFLNSLNVLFFPSKLISKCHVARVQSTVRL